LLFVQYSSDEIAHRAFAEIEMAVGVGVRARLWVLLEALEDRLDTEIFRLADIFESCVVAGKIIGAFHPLHDLLDLGLVLSMHGLSGFLYLGTIEGIEQIIYQKNDFKSRIIISV
jgi:hypothetical protein